MILRLSEREFLATPALWSTEGLATWLREHGFEPTRPFVRYEGEHELVFAQDADEELALLGYAGSGRTEVPRE